MFRFLAWFEIPVRVAPFAVLSLAIILAICVHYPLIVALAATGGVAMFHKLTDSQGIEPWKLIRKKKSKPLPGRGHKIPGL